MSKMIRIITDKDTLPEEETRYLPPHIKEGHVQGAVLGGSGENRHQCEGRTDGSV